MKKYTVTVKGTVTCVYEGVQAKDSDEACSKARYYFDNEVYNNVLHSDDVVHLFSTEYAVEHEED